VNLRPVASSFSRRSAAAGLAAMVLLAPVAACSGDDDDAGGGGDDLSGLLRTMGDDIIVPAYDDLANGLDDLSTALSGLCASPSEQGLTEARSAWGSAASAYQATRPVGVGPAMDRRLMSAVAYPIRADDVAEVLAGTDPITPESLADSGATARGLAAVELLLFEPTASDSLAAGPPDSRRCTYAVAATQVASEASRQVLVDWTEGIDGEGEPYVDTFVAGIDGDPQASLSAVVNEVAHGMQTIDDQGLRGIAAATAPDDVPDTQQDGAAGHKVADLKAQLATIATVVEGPDGDDGLASYVASQDADTADALTSDLAAATGAIDALPDSIADSLAEPDQLATAAEAAATLKVTVSTEVASLLGITIGFSDADGDS
jgi:predicted lipoprotein